MSTENPALLHNPMPQIDFGRAFETDNEPTALALPVVAASLFAAPSPAEPIPKRSGHFGESHWANASFVALTVAGGLFCAFYFFNGAELLRAAAAWPAELLYQRPVESLAFAKIDNRTEAPAGLDIAPPIARQSQPGPFPRSSAALLGLESIAPSLATGAPLTTSPSLDFPSATGPGNTDPLGGLGGTVPNDDSLTVTVPDPSSTVTDTTKDASPTVVKVVGQASERAATATKRIVHKAKQPVRAVKNASARLTSKVVKSATNTTSSVRSTSANGVHGVSGLNSSGIGGINGSGGANGGVGGLNAGGSRGGALGGIGGINGGAGGIGAGGIGGLTGAVHGILGGRH